jgi:hypothetical protein
MQKQINCCGCCRCYSDWYEIKDCKIFEVEMEDRIYDPVYIVIVHFSIPEGFWCAFEVTQAERNERKSNIVEAGRIQLEPLDRIMEHVGCYYCGENLRVCLEWHYLDCEQKEPGINKMTYHYLEKSKTEAQKCEVVCSNCHRKFHADLLPPIARIRQLSLS